MNWVDAFIVVTILWFTYSAFNAGMIREVVTIIGAIFAVALAGLLYTELAKDVEAQLVAIFLKQTAQLLMLGIFDSMGGALIGLIKGVIIIEVALIVAITFQSLNLMDDVEASAFAPFFLDFLPFLKYILPDEFKASVDDF